MMSNSKDKKSRADITKVLNGFNDVETTMYVCVYLGIFDDVRQQIKALIGGNSADWLYRPDFLHKSVLVPCYSIGCILSKKYPTTLPNLPPDHENWKEAKVNIDTWYHTISFLLSFEMVVEYFKILKLMTQDELNSIHLHDIFRQQYFQPTGHLFLAQFSKLNCTGYTKFSVNLRSPMVFEVTDIDKLSPILKAIPLAYLHVKFDKSGCDTEAGERFTYSSGTLQGMYDHEAFWGGNFPKHRVLRIAGSWLNLPRAMRPSEWYNDIFHGPTLLQNNIYMDKDIFKLSVNYSSFDLHKEGADEILDNYLRIANQSMKKNSQNHLLLCSLIKKGDPENSPLLPFQHIISQALIFH